jgi:hypothetical protein
MNAPARSIATDAGPLAVRDLAPGTRAALEELFPTVTEIEHEGQSLLALVPIDGSRVLEGMRTGYGYGGPQPADEFARMLGIERMRIVEATASFRSRGFRGVLVPAACLAGIPDQHSQLGELLFMRVHGPLARGLVIEDPVRGYETMFGAGATDAILSFVKEIIDSWESAGIGGMKVTDMEPCPVNWDGMRWRADIALVDDRIVVLRQELMSEDPLLAALVASGVSEIEHTPSVFLLPPPE